MMRAKSQASKLLIPNVLSRDLHIPGVADATNFRGIHDQSPKLAEI